MPVSVSTGDEMNMTRPPQTAALLALLLVAACDLAGGSVDWQAPLHERSACSAPVAEGIDLPEGFEAVEVLVGGPLTHVTGMALHPDGRIFVSDIGELGVMGDEAIVAIDPATGTHEVIVSGLPLGSPGRLTFDDRTPGALRLMVADWNTEVTSRCCGGHILSIDVDAAPYVVENFSDGLASLTVGDPFGLVLSGPGYGEHAYVMDFQGASAQRPVLYSLDADGNATSFAQSGNLWTTARVPRHIVFGEGDGFHGLYAVDGLPAGPTIWHVDETGDISAFVETGPFITPATARFGRGDAFGTGMFVLDASTKELVVLDAAGDPTVFGTGFTQTTGFSDMAFAPGCGTLYVGMGDRIVAVRPAGVGACTGS